MGGIKVWDNNFAFSSGGFVHEVVHMNLHIMFLLLLKYVGSRYLCVDGGRSYYWLVLFCGGFCIAVRVKCGLLT